MIRARVVSENTGWDESVEPASASARLRPWRDSGAAAPASSRTVGITVDELDGRAHTLAGRDAGAADNEWNVHELVVERMGVALPAVLKELVAVVGGQDDDGALVESAGFEVRE